MQHNTVHCPGGVGEGSGCSCSIFSPPAAFWKWKLVRRPWYEYSEEKENILWKLFVKGVPTTLPTKRMIMGDFDRLGRLSMSL